MMITWNLDWEEYFPDWKNLKKNILGIEINFTWDTDMTIEENTERFWRQFDEIPLDCNQILELDELWEDFCMLIRKYGLDSRT